MPSQNANIPPVDPAKKRRLGRGLNSLLGGPVAVEVTPTATPTHIASPTPRPSAEPQGTIDFIPVSNVAPNPAQPRRRFDERAIVELSESIKSAGVMQPVIVRKAPGAEGYYELVAGERRWRAAKLAGLERLPAIVKELSDAESAQWALIENLQREDLGAMEKAAALRSLVERFSLTHAEAAHRVGVDRVTVTNLIRLLELESEIAAAIENKELSMGHGRALLSVPAGKVRTELAAKAILNHWSVRRLEQEAADVASAHAQPGGAQRKGGDGAGDGSGGAGAESLLARQAGVKDLERQLSEHLGTKVRLLLRRGGTRGRLVAEFFDLDHFDGLVGRMGFKSK